MLGVTLTVWLGDVRAVLNGSEASPRPVREAEAPQAPKVEEIPVHVSQVVDSVRVWLQSRAGKPRDPREDPFLFLDGPGEISGADPAAAVAPPVSVRLPALQGISLGAGPALAVLDRTLVGEGESVGPWKVEKIEQDRVWLDGPGGRQAVRVSREGPAVAAAPRAPGPATPPSLARTNSTAPRR